MYAGVLPAIVRRFEAEWRQRSLTEEVFVDVVVRAVISNAQVANLSCSFQPNAGGVMVT